MQTQTKQMPKGCLYAVLGFIALFAILFIVYEISSDSEMHNSTNWKEMSYEQKDAWIKNYLKNPDDNGFNIIAKMNNEISSKFNYPAEVEYTFGQSPTFVNADVVDADTGTTFVRGSGTAKNANNIKSAFVYAVRLIVTKDTLYVADVSVNLK